LDSASKFMNFEGKKLNIYDLPPLKEVRNGN